jgi:hypothetical protein
MAAFRIPYLLREMHLAETRNSHEEPGAVYHLKQIKNFVEALSAPSGSI